MSVCITDRSVVNPNPKPNPNQRQISVCGITDHSVVRVNPNPNPSPSPKPNPSWCAACVVGNYSLCVTGAVWETVNMTPNDQIIQGQQQAGEAEMELDD
jgi:hypothetical protein